MSAQQEHGMSLAARIAAVEARVMTACADAGRARDEVRLVAVSKKHGPALIAEAAVLGLDVFGENRVQEARQKIPLCPGGLTWHFIGHLQRNKVREAVQWFDMIHAVDSERLLDALNDAAEEAGRTVSILVEVNVSGERSKFGIPPEAGPAVLEHCSGLTSLDVQGLMTMPPFDADPAAARPYFARLRELRDAWRAASGFPLDELSMGMSHDFEFAIAEGATWIRVGTALLGSRKAGAVPPE